MQKGGLIQVSSWLSAVIACAALPPLYIFIQSKYPFSAENVDRYLIVNTLLTLCSGLTGGIGVALLANPASFVSVMTAFLVVMAYSTGAVISHGYYLPSYFAAAGAALLVYSISVTMAGLNLGYGSGLQRLSRCFRSFFWPSIPTALLCRILWHEGSSFRWSIN